MSNVIDVNFRPVVEYVSLESIAGERVYDMTRDREIEELEFLARDLLGRIIHMKLERDRA